VGSASSFRTMQRKMLAAGLGWIRMADFIPVAVHTSKETIAY
jgi:hypothetical protein